MTFRARLLVAFVALLVINTALLLAVSLRTARQSLDAERAASLQDELTMVTTAFGTLAGELRSASERVARDLGDVDAVLGSLGEASTSTVTTWATSLAEGRVDLLWLLREDGTLVSAFPEVEGYGTKDLSLVALHSLGPGPHLRQVTLLGQEAPALLVARRVGTGYVLVVGRYLDPRRAPRGAATPHYPAITGVLRSRVDAAVVLAVGDSTLLVDPDDEEVRAGFDPVPGDASPGLARGPLLDGLTVYVVGDDRLFQSIRDRLTRVAVLVASITLLLSWALAWVLARSLSAPLDRFTTATRRIARGTWDEPVEASGSVPELATLEAAFNRMQEELRRQQDALRRAERMAAWRDAARRVAHEIKNTLTPLQLTGERLRRLSDAETEIDRASLRQSADGIATEIRGLRRLLGDFSELARWPDPDIREVNVVDLVRHTTALYEDADGPVVETTLPPDLRLPLDAGQFTRALSNLLQNALDVAPRGSTVRVRVEPGPSRVTVSVTDDGPGMDDETRERMFTPYYTTKSGGTGLGLSIVERVAEAHGATVRVETAPGQGTMIALDLPRTSPPETGAATDAGGRDA